MGRSRMVLILGLVPAGYGRRRYGGMLRGTAGRGGVELPGWREAVCAGGCRGVVGEVAVGSPV